MTIEGTVVYVHGNGNKVARDALKAKWDNALFGEEAGTATRMAYYADKLYPAGPLPSFAEDIELGGVSALEGLDDQLEPVDEFRVAVIGEYEVPAASREAFESFVSSLSDRAEVVADEEPRSALEVADFLPKPLRKRLLRGLLKVTFRDVHSYFFGDTAEVIRQELRAELTDAGSPLVVIGHSLGSIVAYDVLREDQFRERPVDLFLTVGSPLGITEIQDLVTQPLAVPTQVNRWYNLADALDVVALDKKLSGEYPPDHKISDDMVRNDTPNHHGITGYLTRSQTRGSVRAVFE